MNIWIRLIKLTVLHKIRLVKKRKERKGETWVYTLLSKGIRLLKFIWLKAHWGNYSFLMPAVQFEYWTAQLAQGNVWFICLFPAIFHQHVKVTHRLHECQIYRPSLNAAWLLYELAIFSIMYHSSLFYGFCSGKYWTITKRQDCDTFSITESNILFIN